MTKLVQALAEELLVWRANLVNMRGTNDKEVDDLIGHIDASINSVNGLHSADEADNVVR